MCLFYYLRAQLHLLRTLGTVFFKERTINFVYFYSYAFYEVNSIDTHHIIHSSLLAIICIIFGIQLTLCHPFVYFGTVEDGGNSAAKLA
jgi:hypothetical protein